MATPTGESSRPARRRGSAGREDVRDRVTGLATDSSQRGPGELGAPIDPAALGIPNPPTPPPPNPPKRE